VKRGKGILRRHAESRPWSLEGCSTLDSKDCDRGVAGTTDMVGADGAVAGRVRDWVRAENTEVRRSFAQAGADFVRVG
jgi:hypothetical protein